MEIFYLKDKVCTLRSRDGLATEESFTLEAPNGVGIHDIDIEKIDSDHYVDGNGDLATGFTDFRLCLYFHYSSNKMALERLIEFEEIDIPFSFSLNPADEVTETFILDNEEMVFNYIHGLYQGVDGENIKGGIELVFKSSKIYTRQEIEDILFYQGDQSLPGTPQNLTYQFLNTNPYSIVNNGIDGAIRIPQSSSIDFKDEFTFECDVKRPETGVVDRIFWQRQTTPSAGGGFFGFHSDDTVRLTFFGVGDVIFTTKVEDTDWHHIAIAISDTSLVTLYIDGVQVETAQLASSPNSAPNSDLGLTCSITDDTIGTSYNLFLDNVRFWNIERSSLQISSNIDVLLDGDEAGLTAYYKCDENGTPANTLVDSVASNNGALSGGMFYSDLVRFREEPVELSWGAVSGVDGYNVYLSTDGGGFVKINVSTITETTYNIEDLSEGSYQAYVTSVIGALESSPSNTVDFDVVSGSSAFGETWTGHSAYSVVNNEYIQYTAPNSSAFRTFTCVGLGNLDDYEIYADFASFGDADNEGDIFGLRVMIGASKILRVTYTPGFMGDDSVRVHDGTVENVLNGNANIAPEQIVSAKLRKIGDTIDLNWWIPSVVPEPDYGSGQYAFTKLMPDEAGQIGICGTYGFSNWRCTKFDVVIL